MLTENKGIVPDCELSVFFEIDIFHNRFFKNMSDFVQEEIL